jgi:hypothetical protein
MVNNGLTLAKQDSRAVIIGTENMKDLARTLKMNAKKPPPQAGEVFNSIQ